MLRLEPYKTKASRYECPACGHKYVFVRYVDEAGNHLAPEVGRCNRESKCGYHLKPRDYFTTHAARPSTAPPNRPKSPPQPVVLSEIPVCYLEESRRAAEQNAFVRFLLCHYSREQVLQVCEQYLLGDFEGFTTFWRVDERGREANALQRPNGPARQGQHGHALAARQTETTWGVARVV